LLLVLLRSNLHLGLLLLAPSSNITEGQMLYDPLAALGASPPPIAKDALSGPFPPKKWTIV
jgi:hypothetical protein